MIRPLEIRNVENISLEASDDSSDMYPQLVAQFACPYDGNNDCINIKIRTLNVLDRFLDVCCSAILMVNVTHAAIESIGITVRSPNVSAIILQQCSYVHIFPVNSTRPMCYYNDPQNISSQNYGYDIGLLIHESSYINVSSLQVSRFSHGVILYNISNTKISYITAANNSISGLLLNMTNTTHIANSHALQNQYNGIEASQCTDTSMTNISAAHNHYDGIYLLHCAGTRMMNISSALNKYDGIYLNSCTDTSFMNISVAHNMNDGIVMLRCTDTSIMNIAAAYNCNSGITMYGIINTRVYHASTHHNNQDGMYMNECRKVLIVYLSSTRNKRHGISVVLKSVEVKIMNAVVNDDSGINVKDADYIHISNTTSSITAYSTSSIAVNDATFSNMISLSTASSASDPTSQPAVITLYGSILSISDCTFTRNVISSVKAVGSNITLSGEVIFSNNRALYGTAFILAENSILIIKDYANVVFQKNHAINYGGVFYISTEEFYGTSISLQDILEDDGGSSLITSRTKCFVHVEGSRSYARLTFLNNTAGKGGDVLYGGLVALGYDGDWNCLLSFKNISDMTQQHGLSPISSAPSRVCFCNATGQPDCLTVADPTQHVIYPGQTITISAVVVGQDFGTTTGSVFAQFLYTTGSVVMEQGQNSTYRAVDHSSREIVHSYCSSLDYTVFSHESEDSDIVLILAADNRDVFYLMNENDNREISNSWAILHKGPDYQKLAMEFISGFFTKYTFPNQFSSRYYESNMPANRTIENFYKFTPGETIQPNYIHSKFVFPREIYDYPVYINISFLPCPPGFSLSRDPPFRCDCNQLLQQLPGVKCHIQDQTITRSGLVWVGSNGNETVASSNCPFDYCFTKQINLTLDDSDSQCNLNHSGTLCGECQPGLSLALGSNQCLHCPNTNIALLIPHALAGVVLVFFIKVLDLTISQGTLNGLIYYANIVKANDFLLLTEMQTNPLAVFIAWLNLDWGIETCFFSGLTVYGKMWLQFVFPVYIWSIAGLIIIVAKYSDRAAKLFGNNSVPVLATLFLLSYAKLFRAIITVLSFTILSTAHDSKAVWSADGNLDYLGPKHAPLFAVAVATLLFLWLPYTLLLFLGQWLHRCNCHLITRMMMKIKPFLDAHYGSLRGNHRYWFGALLLVRTVVLLMSALIPANLASTVVYSITVCALVLACYAPIVYHNLAVSTFDAVWFVNLGLLSASHTFTKLEGRKFRITSNVHIGLAFVQFLGLILFKAFIIIKRMPCLHKGQPTEDDWELYEEAALLREIESDSEGEESEECGSNDSLPTYGL